MTKTTFYPKHPTFIVLAMLITLLMLPVACLATSYGFGLLQRKLCK